MSAMEAKRPERCPGCGECKRDKEECHCWCHRLTRKPSKK